MIPFLVLGVLASQPIDAGEALRLPVLIHVPAGVRAPFRGLDLFDALDLALRRHTQLRAFEVGADVPGACAQESRCLLEHVASRDSTGFALNVIVGARSTEVLLVSVGAVRRILDTAREDTDVLEETLSHAVLISAAEGKFRDPGDLGNDAEQFVTSSKDVLSAAGLWGELGQVTARFGGAVPSMLRVNGATLSVATNEEVIVTGLRPGRIELVAESAWARAALVLELPPGGAISADLYVPEGPGVLARPWLLGAGATAASAGAALLVGMSIAAATGPSRLCLQPSGSPGAVAPCETFRVGVPVGSTLVGLGVGGVVAGILESDAGTPIQDFLLVLTGGAVGAAIGFAAESLK